MDEESERLETEVWLEQFAPELPEDERERFEDAVGRYYELPAIAGRRRFPMESLQEDYRVFGAILQAMRHEDSLAAVSLRAGEAQAELNAWIRGTAALGATEAQLAEQSGLPRAAVHARLGR